MRMPGNYVRQSHMTDAEMGFAEFCGDMQLVTANANTQGGSGRVVAAGC